MENDEVVIDLRVLLWEVLRKWHIILIVCAVFAVLAGMFGVYRNKSAQKQKEVPIEQLYVDMEPEEITKVKNLISVQERIDEKAEYGKNSVYMSLNPYDVDKAEIDFLLSKNSENKYIRQMYLSYMFDGEMYSNIVKGYKGEIGIEDICELISYSGQSGRTNIAEDSENNYEKGDDINNIISITIFGKDEEQCKEFVSLVIENVKSFEKEIQKKYDNHSITETSSGVYKTVSLVIANTKSSYDQQLTALYNEYNMFYNSFDESQIALYERLIDDAKEDSGTASTEEETGSGISIKYIAVGILLGGFLVVVIIVILTMFNGKVFVQRQITDRGFTRVFGTFGKNKNNFASMILGDVGTDKQSQLDIIVAKVNMYCKKNGTDRLTIIDNCSTEHGKARLKQVVDAIIKSGINCTRVALSEGEQKYTELCDKNNIVIIEELGKGTLKELEYMFMQLKELESELSGVICVQ